MLANGSLISGPHSNTIMKFISLNVFLSMALFLKQAVAWPVKRNSLSILFDCAMQAILLFSFLINLKYFYLWSTYLALFLFMGLPRPLFVYFRHFQQEKTSNFFTSRSDCKKHFSFRKGAEQRWRVLGSNRGRRIEGADVSIGLVRIVITI